jgi:hypothetical protein
MKTFYFSFANSSGWLWSCIVRGDDISEALEVAHVCKLVPEDRAQLVVWVVNESPPARFFNVKLDLAAVRELDSALGGSGRVCDETGTIVTGNRGE